MWRNYVPTMSDVEKQEWRKIISEGYIPPTTFNSGYFGFKIFDSRNSCICTNNCVGDNNYFVAITVGQVI